MVGSPSNSSPSFSTSNRQQLGSCSAHLFTTKTNHFPLRSSALRLYRTGGNLLLLILPESWVHAHCPPPPTHTSPALRCDLGQSDSSILPPCFASPSRHQNRAGLPSKFTPTKRSYVSIEASIKSRVSLKSATKINIESIASKSSPRTGNTNLAGLPT